MVAIGQLRCDAGVGAPRKDPRETAPIGGGGHLITARRGIRHTFFGVATAPQLPVRWDDWTEIRQVRAGIAPSKARL